MGILETIRAHSQPEKVRTIEVPEWGKPAELDAKGEEVKPAEPLVIHYRMVTLAELAEAQRLSSDPMRQAAELVCMKACNADGTAIFRRIEVLEMMEVAAPEVVMRIADAMGRRKSADDIRKNS